MMKEGNVGVIQCDVFFCIFAQQSHLYTRSASWIFLVWHLFMFRTLELRFDKPASLAIATGVSFLDQSH